MRLPDKGLVAVYWLFGTILRSGRFHCGLACRVQVWYNNGASRGLYRYGGGEIMATDVNYIEYVCEQIQGIGDVRYKKMFGEYMVYVDDKPVLLVCDNTVFVKKHEQIAELMTIADCGTPYDGAKEHYILDIDDTDLVQKVLAILVEVTPLPKKKRK